MRFGDLFKTLRGWSWLFGALSLAPVGIGVYQSLQFSHWAAARAARGEFVCGTGIVTLQFLCATLALALAVTAGACGVAAYRKAPRPRSGKRAVELVLVAGVAVLGIFAGLVAWIVSVFR